MTKTDRPKNPVQLAVIGAAQGLRGEVRVKSFTGDPMALGDYGPLTTGDGRMLTVRQLRPVKNVVVAQFAEVGDRNAAEALNGTALFVERAALPAELDEEEYYHADLIGLAAVDEAGQRFGTIGALHNFGAGDILEVTLATGGSALVPFTRAAVPSIDLAAKVARFDRAAAGLLEDEDDEAGPEEPAGDSA
ncbi:ribosome maturation factor RimM [Nitratireductor pacificus]|uniref:Ribosome maturation factor RimM n=1 Tax=Nitratireductor pacificus pht-3B TaxID=391937 RepID=K2MD87_9HYPH|nr:ribosome maturation factor RimM [Nitratireductor pacificus]EKF18740.1 16S rRNA-processing protein RimM [Nitratireductor pacificus pht-3B]